MKSARAIQRIVARKGEHPPPGIYSICSANPHVLEAAARIARDRDLPFLVETTCHQVNQVGGYTGQTPHQFVHALTQWTDAWGLSREVIVLGGDHLGPSPWRGKAAEEALAHAAVMVRQYVAAGYTKLHFDASMACRDDPETLSPEIIAGRQAQLCEAAVDEIFIRGLELDQFAFVVGTEVPAAGGARQNDSVAVSSVTDTDENISLARNAFQRLGLEAAWEQTVAFVVQPGVEFGDAVVHAYDRKKARSLSQFIAKVDGLVFEAHSTDYQSRAALRKMVEDHFAILKVGPALTHVLRQGLLALEAIEKELSAETFPQLSCLSDTLEQAMIANPGHWKEHYSQDPDRAKWQRKYSRLDRCRYYWAEPKVLAAVARLMQNLSSVEIPSSLLESCMPQQARKVIQGQILSGPDGLLSDKISSVIEDYAYACAGWHA